METTMKDDAHLKRERQKRKLKVIFAVAMGIVPIATFFLPYVNYTFKDSTFVLSAYQILTSPGILSPCFPKSLCFAGRCWL